MSTTPAGPQSVPGAPLSESDDKLYASLAHFLNIILLIPAIIIYAVFHLRGPRVGVESKEALNWTINVTALFIIGQILSAIFNAIPYGYLVSLLIGIALWLLIVLNIVFAIIGGLRVQAGGSYRYPVNIRWIK